MVSGRGHILDIIKLIIEYDIPTVSDTTLRARTKIITKGLNNNLIIILKGRASSSELSDVSEDFESMAVDDDDDDNVKELQSKKRKRNKCYYTEDVTYGFQSSIASNKKMDIIKYI